MRKVAIALVYLITVPSVGHTAPSTRQLAATASLMESQRTLLRAASNISLDGTPTPLAQKDRFAFPIGGRWMQLGQDNPAIDEPTGFITFTVLLRTSLDSEPINAVSYLWRNTESKPIPLTDGYAARERTHLIHPKGLPLIAVVERAFNRDATSYSSGVIDEIGEPVRTVWISDPSARHWEWGFSDLENKNVENLVVRTSAGPTALRQQRSLYDGFDLFANFNGSEATYRAYRWTGETLALMAVRPELLQNLPASVWQYGSHN